VVFSPEKGWSLISLAVGKGALEVGKGYDGEGACEMTERRARRYCSNGLESGGARLGEVDPVGKTAAIAF
jgi:hypothetical protein